MESKGYKGPAPFSCFSHFPPPDRTERTELRLLVSLGSDMESADVTKPGKETQPIPVTLVKDQQEAKLHQRITGKEVHEPLGKQRC